MVIFASKIGRLWIADPIDEEKVAVQLEHEKFLKTLK